MDPPPEAPQAPPSTLHAFEETQLAQPRLAPQCPNQPSGPSDDPCSIPDEPPTVLHLVSTTPATPAVDMQPSQEWHQPLPQSHRTTPKLFLDIFAGTHCPLTKAVHALGGDFFAPFHFALHSSHDIVDDRVMHLMMKLCFSGIVGAAWSAPPCKEFSRLKLKRPGPKLLRTPQHMDGVPGLTPAEQAKVDASTEIHVRSRKLLRGVVSAAGQAGMEQPPPALSWLQADNIALLREWCAHCAHIAACNHGMDYYKSWATCATFQSIASLACTCQHAPGTHRSIAGVQVEGKFSALSPQNTRQV